MALKAILIIIYSLARDIYKPIAFLSLQKALYFFVLTYQFFIFIQTHTKQEVVVEVLGALVKFKSKLYFIFDLNGKNSIETLPRIDHKLGLRFVHNMG